ncbi:MAG: DUF4347 domain-containing protein, partial [Pseudomonadota bacterium]
MSAPERTTMRFSVEALEPRLLLAADWAAVLAPPWSDDAGPERWSDLEAWLPSQPLSVADGSVSDGHGVDALDLGALRELHAPHGSVDAAPRVELVVVDTAVEGYEQLVADITGRSGNVQYSVHLIDSATDGVAALTAVLADHDDLDAVHLVAHGDAGGFQLGSTWLDSGSFDRYADAIGGWADAFRANADLLVYGCNLADSSAGLDLLESLAELTGADVAASTDLTGHADLGGNWSFEVHIGKVESAVAFSADLQAQWTGVLAAFVVNTQADTVDINPGDGVALDAFGNTSLRAAIMESNALAGADFIQLPAGTYTFNLGGSDINPAATGDL